MENRELVCVFRLFIINKNNANIKINVIKSTEKDN